MERSSREMGDRNNQMLLRHQDEADRQIERIAAVDLEIRRLTDRVAIASNEISDAQRGINQTLQSSIEDQAQKINLLRIGTECFDGKVMKEIFKRLVIEPDTGLSVFSSSFNIESTRIKRNSTNNGNWRQMMSKSALPKHGQYYIEVKCHSISSNHIKLGIASYNCRNN